MCVVLPRLISVLGDWAMTPSPATNIGFAALVISLIWLTQESNQDSLARTIGVKQTLMGLNETAVSSLHLGILNICTWSIFLTLLMSTVKSS